MKLNIFETFCNGILKHQYAKMLFSFAKVQGSKELSLNHPRNNINVIKIETLSLCRLLVDNES